MFESKSGVFLVAGLGFFILAFAVMGLVPIVIYHDEPELSVKELAEQGIIHEFVELAEKFPDQFKEHFGEVTTDSFAAALKRGHKIYIGEACWHCHSQQIRPVSNEDIRWGPRSYAAEYQNVLQRPVLFGTRRVGPDLIREGARKSNDWHIAHFYKPRSVAPVSVMPEYPWFFDKYGYPNRDGMAIITYIQWLGSWHQDYPYWRGEGPGGGSTMPAASAEKTASAVAEGVE
ncbi:MAG: cbb3-type cytochrome c oxidase subunit II [Phycisphaerae bacterium]|nr:cbb3-type cytochrome c oxidase subunit II [Phycisphaerae bacterium]